MAVWVCLKQGSENIVLVVLLQIGAKDLIVFSTHQGSKKSKIGWELTKSGCHVRSQELLKKTYICSFQTNYP